MLHRSGRSLLFRLALPSSTMTSGQKKGMMTAAASTGTSSTRAPKGEGSIADIFTSLTGEAHNVLPDRFAGLKKELWKDSLVESWREVLEALPEAVQEIEAKGSEIIPRVRYQDIQAGLSQDQVEAIKRVGTVIVTGGIPPEEALSWKQSIRDYAAANANRVTGFPPDNIQVFEIYNSLAQTRARTHPALIATQKFLLSLWHASSSHPQQQQQQVSLQTPISYFDRLRIRQPGDAQFALGPHTDGGSVERWEDEGLRRVFGRILAGGGTWRAHDPFDATPRIGARQDMYHSSNACSIFRAWQGWTSLSSTGPGEGTLRVLPMLSLATAYTVLRPFFRPRHSSSTSTSTSSLGSLKFEDWVPDLDTPTFPGSSIGKTQELNERTHPHLQLGKTMVSIPRVEPGDQVYWHCDVVHAVESRHGGLGDSSVFYIPAVPLTLHNASYLRDQRINFLAGLPPPDFPGGQGESKFVGRASADDVPLSGDGAARQLYGLEGFVPDEERGLSRDFVERVNKVLL